MIVRGSPLINAPIRDLLVHYKAREEVSVGSSTRGRHFRGQYRPRSYQTSATCGILDFSCQGTNQEIRNPRAVHSPYHTDRALDPRVEDELNIVLRSLYQEKISRVVNHDP